MVLKRIYCTGAMSWVYSFLTNSIIKLIAFALALKPKDSLGTRLPPTHTHPDSWQEVMTQYPSTRAPWFILQTVTSAWPGAGLSLCRGWCQDEPFCQLHTGAFRSQCLGVVTLGRCYFQPFFWEHWGFQLVAFSLKSTLCVVGVLPTLPDGLTCVIAPFGLHLILSTTQRAGQ